MSHRRRFTRKPMPLLAVEHGPEDGIDPRFLPRYDRGMVTNRKALQVCRQVERTLGILLAGACGDDVLRDLVVASVVPAPDSTRLLVTLTFSGLATEAGAVQARLREAHGFLRSEVAAALHRRKAPELTFQVLRSTL
jgi:ribosome-binding factor A